MFKNFLIKKGLSDSTITAYLYQIKRFKKIVKINEISTDIIRRYLYSCNKKYSPGTIRIILGSLEKYCEYKNFEMDKSIKTNLKIKEKSIFMDTLSKREVLKFVNCLVEKSSFQQKRNSLLIKFLYYSGVRVSELINLRRKQIKKDYVSILGKGNKRRNVPIPKSLIKELNLWTNQGFIFKNKDNTQMSTRSINKIIKKRLLNTKINKSVSAHTFRRSYCTNLMKSGANIKIISLLMGHSKIETTARYMHFTKEDILKEYLEHI